MSVMGAAFSILALIILSGIFSLFVSALNQCRKTRLEKESGKLYKPVINALANPAKICAECRVWINLLRIASAFIAGYTAARFYGVSHHSGISAILIIAAFSAIIGVTAALLGDGIPFLFSRLAPEKIAAWLMTPVKALCFPLKPLILTVFKIASFFHSTLNPETNENNLTDDELQDELRNVLMEGEKSGVVESKERTMVEGVFYLGDRPVGAFMTHRSEIQWLDVNAPYEETKEKALTHKRQRCFPVVDGSPDAIVGAVYLEDIILDITRKHPQGLRAIMKDACFIPQTMSALKAFESFRQGQANFLFVMDEYGGLSGIISIRALVEEIIGELPAGSARKEETLIKSEDGSILAEGMLNIDDVASELSIAVIGEENDFHTLAGFILSLAEELPRVGDSFEYQNYRFTVKEMDGNRIDKILIVKL